jgi:ubiquinone/menaquinone biosynthesis C-methylase UbiE
MKNILFGNEVERMPDFVFRMMKVFFVVYYFFKPAGRYLKKFGIRPGFTVIDYGCGTGAFIKDAASLAGTNGYVYAVDVHEMAIASVEKLITKNRLTNVKSVLSDGKQTDIPNDTADLIYALDMFHMVKDSTLFLRELNRIIKKGGILILEDGHQPRKVSKQKISVSALWKITEENNRFMKCVPIK